MAHRETELLTLIADVSCSADALEGPHGYVVRSCRPSDVEKLGHLYFESYDPPNACRDLAEAIADMEATFAGAYGELWQEASLVATAESGEIVAAIQVVHRAPWDDTPDCPFIIELFTARAHRRRGLGHALMLRSMGVVAETGHKSIALRVHPENMPALRLYQRLGFH
jgi:N-alpha-acetyltransferase 10/11